jgi:hypothetical protein
MLSFKFGTIRFHQLLMNGLVQETLASNKDLLADEGNRSLRSCHLPSGEVIAVAEAL